ncbi:hypothetical protein [Corynebacterium pseudopelargi]|uniref:Uncharacterized protein n=1 Tax=Corynebacterium pseudopelargi TaxID=2080757 RepID=A0A3G6ISZ0_9CORY|nr:hypothetical protein [Corynebacterium pseudopelargi]AZA08713.1 hypothetical protein CPPEL_02910 [Corynebacterium pseudopelargi]
MILTHLTVKQHLEALEDVRALIKHMQFEFAPQYRCDEPYNEWVYMHRNRFAITTDPTYASWHVDPEEIAGILERWEQEGLRVRIMCRLVTKPVEY